MDTAEFIKTWGGWALAGAKAMFDIRKSLLERAEKRRSAVEIVIDARIEEVVQPLLLHATLHQINQKLDEVKTDVSALHDDVGTLTADVARLEGINEGRYDGTFVSQTDPKIHLGPSRR